MKRFLIILVAIIGFGIGANAQNCSEYTCNSCGASLYSSSQAYWTDCVRCGGMV